MADLFPITLADQIACVEREIKMRERVYPRWVADGKMKQEKSDHELAAMRAVLATLNAHREFEAHQRRFPELSQEE